MQARDRLVRVAFWLRNGWCKPATDDLVVINDRDWVALLCDAMVWEIFAFTCFPASKDERRH